MSEEKKLIEYLKNHLDENVRIHCAGELGKTGGQEAIDALVYALKHDECDEVKEQSERAIKLIKISEEDRMIDYLNVGSEENRISAARELHEYGTEKSINPRISCLLDDRSDEVRRVSAWSLGIIGCEKTVFALKDALLNDECDEVRENSAESIGKIGSKDSVTELEDALLTDVSEFVRYESAWALGKSGSKESINVLKKEVRTDTSEYVRHGAGKAITRIKEGSESE